MAHDFESELEDEMEEELEGEMEDEAGLEGEGWLGAIGNIASSLLGETESEDESEDETEGESEDEISPIRKIYADAMMEHLGEMAAEAESEDEAAEQFLPLIGMAASKLLPVVARAVAPAARKALPHIAKALTRATPQLTRGVGKVAKVLHRNPQTRHLLRTVPGIARRTVGHIARQAAQGRTITPRTAVRTLATQARHVLGNPRRRVHALRHHNHLERRFHGHLARGMARPHARRYGWTGQAPASATHPAARGYAATRGTPGVYQPHVGTHAVAGSPSRHGQMVAGQCNCPACPTCGGTSTAAANPAYCRCCGQVIR
jgi:hypothetical protein